MSVSKRTIIILGLGVVLCSFILMLYVLPVTRKFIENEKAYQTRVAIRNDYTLHTTPLTSDVIIDICTNLNIKQTSENCRLGEIVYGPDFFDEIKSYFNNLPDQDKTYDLVQDKLGAYLVRCEEPASDGHFRCRYDIRGDAIYPIFFYFDKDGFYYRIIANTGGS